MSKEAGADTSNAVKAAEKFVNPYAKKAKSASANQGHRDAAKDRRKSGGLQPVEIGASATFSQAFSSVEETTHFQNELSNAKRRGSENTNQLESWAEQRAFDADAAAEDTTAPESESMSDRDHHALMQPHVLYVSTKQRGNGLLKHIRNVPFAFSKMVPDYIMNTSRCALFLSCKYHSLYPNYIHRRIAELKNDFVLRVLLVLVDVEDNASTLLFLNKLAVVNNMTLILAWSEEEAARYLETYKAFDGKDASSIQRREQSHFADQVADVLSSVRSVNKSDSAQLLNQFSSLKAVIAASVDELCVCPGLGEKKVQRLHDAFHKPFSSRQSKRRREAKLEESAPIESTVIQTNGKGDVEGVDKDKGDAMEAAIDGNDKGDVEGPDDDVKSESVEAVIDGEAVDSASPGTSAREQQGRSA